MKNKDLNRLSSESIFLFDEYDDFLNPQKSILNIP